MENKKTMELLLKRRRLDFEVRDLQEGAMSQLECPVMITSCFVRIEKRIDLSESNLFSLPGLLHFCNLIYLFILFAKKHFVLF